MVCNLTCAIAVGFIFASIYTMMTPKTEMEKLKSMVDSETAKIYDDIAAERFKLYVQGLILGLIASLLFLYANRNVYYETSFKVCLFVVIVAVFQIGYYELMPKSKWMLDYLSTQEQNTQWLKIYKMMKNRWHLGFFIGIIGFVILGHGICKE